MTATSTDANKHAMPTASFLLIALPAVAMLLTGCAQTTPTGARTVTPMPTHQYAHQVIAKPSDNSLEGLLIHIEMHKDLNHAPIQYDLNILKEALETEIRARGGESLAEPSAEALILRVNVSRYLTERLPQMPKNGRIRTYLDYTSRMDHAEGRSLPADRVRSIQGVASSIQDAHIHALHKFVASILTEPRTAAFLAEHRLNAEGLTRMRLARLAKDLFRRADHTLQNAAANTPIRVALAPLQNDPENTMAAQVLPPLMDCFTLPAYQFFTRTQLASILEEQSLQMMDLVDQKTTVRAGKIQGVDYMVTGSIMPGSQGTAVQIQLLSVASGQVIASASVLTPQ